jgi:hypothetical protein
VQSLVCLILIKRLRRRRAGRLRGEPCHGSHDRDGDRAGMLLAVSGRCGAIDAIVVHIGWQSDGCCSPQSAGSRVLPCEPIQLSTAGVAIALNVA